MPFIFGLIQWKTHIWAHPIYVGIFATLNCIFIEKEFKLFNKNSNNENKKRFENKENNKVENQ